MTLRKRALLLVMAIAICGLLLLEQCSALPSIANRTRSTALPDTRSTRLGRTISPLVSAHAPHSGIYPLLDARDAFAARVRLAETADRSLDVQYYIWHKDMSGTLLLDALRAAAVRGVRVRLLLDDNNTAGLDATLAALDAHPNIEVRLFNPFVIRRVRPIGYLTDFSRLNRRMHNKSFTADNQATIIGGRNVGDEYFGATDDVLFADLDVLAVGPVVREVSADFDRYWASGSSYPLDRLVPAVSADALAQFAAEAGEISESPAAVAYRNALAASSFVRQINDRTLPLEWVTTRMISDDPVKALGRSAPDSLLIDQLRAIFGVPQKRLDLISPYFVPGTTGVELFSGWAKQGVAVRVLTNSLEATDVPAVHAGYAKRRAALLAGGIRLFELRRASGTAQRRAAGSMGSSGSSLHAKTFAVDGSRVFIGSFNFDPRSASLNTEMGFVIESADLARGIARVFDERIPTDAYEVRLSGDRLQWVESRQGRLVQHDEEPGGSAWLRAGVWLLSHLPIEWLL